MNINQLKRVKELIGLIETTEKAINDMENWILNSRKSVGSSVSDMNYNLCVCEHEDGSGNQLNCQGTSETQGFWLLLIAS